MFLSIVVPSYNVEDYLAECLDSCLHQDIPATDYEILCVDDGSTDKTPMICEEYSNAHENIRVHHQTNQWQSGARNSGLDIAKGDWIWFVDADDLICPNCLSELKTIAESSSELQRINFGVYRFFRELTEHETQMFSEKTLAPNAYYADAIVTNSIYKRDYLLKSGIRFRTELRCLEDTMFMFDLNTTMPPKTERILNRVLYLYRIRGNSVSTTGGTEIIRKKMESAFLCAEVAKERIEGLNPELASNAFLSYYHSGMQYLSHLPTKEVAKQFKLLRQKGSFPCKVPKTCTDTKAYVTERKDWLGKFLTYSCSTCHRIDGFVLLRIYNFVYRLASTLKHREAL